MFDTNEMRSDFTDMEQAFQLQANALQAKIEPKRKTRAFNLIKRSFIPVHLQDDSITFKSMVVTATMGSGKTTLLSAFANSIEDSWLAESDIFYDDPLIVFANSLPAVFNYIEEEYDRQDYLYIAVDDAMEHASSRMGMSRGGRRNIFDYARVRHILNDRCQVRAPSFANFFWVTQRFKELSPMMRGAQMFFYKAINVGEGDLTDLQKVITEDGVNWLSGITEQIYLWNNYDFMDYFLLLTSWDPSPYYMRLDRKGKSVRKYDLVKDRTHDQQLEEQMAFLMEYGEQRPDFIKTVHTKQGSAIIEDLITNQFPDTIVTSRKTYIAFTRMLFETGIFAKQKEEGGKRAKLWKLKFYLLVDHFHKMNMNNPTKIMEIAPQLGFSNPNAMRNWLTQNRAVIDGVELKE